MGSLRVIFEMKDTTLYNKLESSGLLQREGYSSEETGLGVITKRNFDRLKAPYGLDRCFLSPDYQAFYGDFESTGTAVKLDEQFGPAKAFCVGLNSADLSSIYDFVEQGLVALDSLVPGARKFLKYTGLLIMDYPLLKSDSGDGRRKKIEALLAS
ncbi:MAG: hypothetical protein AABX33_01245 [Nanoarchaeota archaeon]